MSVFGKRAPVAARSAPMRRMRVKASKRARRARGADVADIASEPVSYGRGGAGDGRAQHPVVSHVGSRTFYFVDERWIDANYDEKDETTKVELFTEEYFKLIRKHPELARCFALGKRVIVVLDGRVFETIPPPQE